MADERKEGSIVRCPSCGMWIMRGAFEGESEINCRSGRCGATLLISIRSGKVTVTVLAIKQA